MTAANPMTVGLWWFVFGLVEFVIESVEFLAGQNNLPLVGLSYFPKLLLRGRILPFRSLSQGSCAIKRYLQRNTHDTILRGDHSCLGTSCIRDGVFVLCMRAPLA